MIRRLQYLFRNSLLGTILAFTLVGNVTVGTVATLSIVAVVPAVTQTSCNKDQLVSAANDVLSVVTDPTLIKALQTLSPPVLAQIEALVPTAKNLITAIKNGDTTNALALVNTIFPVIETAFGVLSAGNPAVLAVLALANIALHFIVNHVQSNVPKIAKTSAAVRVAQDFGSKPVWGCNYRSDNRCKALQR